MEVKLWFQFKALKKRLRVENKNEKEIFWLVQTAIVNILLTKIVIENM